MGEATGRDDVLGGAMEELSRVAEDAARRLSGAVDRYAEWALETLRSGGTLFYCGNGGSASTAAHVAAEYVVRFQRERAGLPAAALGENSSVVTAAANDFSYEEVFARQLRALAGPGDLLVLHSTSGESPNLIAAAEEATRLEVRSVALLAKGGGALRDLVDLAIVVPTDDTARAQEIQLAIEHAVADRVDGDFAGDEAEGA